MSFASLNVMISLRESYDMIALLTLNATQSLIVARSVSYSLRDTLKNQGVLSHLFACAKVSRSNLRVALSCKHGLAHA